MLMVVFHRMGHYYLRMKEPTPIHEADSASYRSDWEAIGGDMRQALGEVAMQIGGDDLAYRVNRIASRDPVFPDGSAIIPLQRIDQNARKYVSERFHEIGAERREAEQAASLSQTRRRAFFQGLGSILNLFGTKK